MKLKVLTDFRDRENFMKLRKAGEIIEATKERAERLAALGLAKPHTDEKVKKGGDPASPEKVPG